MVRSDAGARTQNLMCGEGLLGSQMNRRHEPSRLVCSNWQQSHAWRSKLLPNPREMIAESGVTGEIHHAVLAFNDESAPQSSISIENSTAREMEGRDTM